MREKDCKRVIKERLGTYPLNIRQALHLITAIIRRIEEKRLDKCDNESLITSVQEDYGGSNEK
ncbi:MAG: hypothetical protein WCR98_04100 [Saccharofermentanales bacterium]